MEMILLKPESPEWNYAWGWLAVHPINVGFEKPDEAENFENGEKWRYQGSYRQEGKVIHEFLHKSFPTTNEKKILNLFASESMNAEDIEKIIPIK